MFKYTKRANWTDFNYKKLYFYKYILYFFYLLGVANNVMNAARRLPQVPEATTNGGFFSKLFGKKDQQHHPQVCFTQLIVLDFLYKSNSFFNRQISGLEPVLSLLKNHV